ncbi:MAG: leucine-rich repeat domain-containing protein [Ruminococcaceae bacterium]|nr:leucine-rich repeat domain-containing protein [Oscillospiraceae bacterium]
MKKKIILALVLVSALMCLFAISVSAVEVDGIYYSVSGSGETAYATVTSENRGSCTLETVVIPATIEVGGVTYKVTTIAQNAFGIVNGDPNAYIKHLTIGANVSTVEQHAFRRITTLQTVKIENTEAASPINFHNAQFMGCTGLTKVEAKNAKVSSYGGNCFDGCSSLVTVDYPSTLTSLGASCFKDCTKLTSGDLFNTQITSIGSWAFGSCKSLANFKFPTTLTSIGNNCFLYCPVETFIFPHSMNSFGKDMLAHMSALKVIVMPAIDQGATLNFLYGTRPNVVIYSGDNVNDFKNSYSAFSGYDVQPFANYVPGTKYSTNTIFYGANKTCSICNGLYASEEAQFVFTDYMTDMKYGKLCSHCENVATTKTVDKMFTYLGYSAIEDGTGAISIKYIVNKASIETYFAETEKVVNFGMYAATKDALKGGDILDNEGNPNVGAFRAKMDSSFCNIELKLTGFTTEELKATKFAIGAYVEVTSGETTEYVYLEKGEKAEGDKYQFVSYNDVLELA